jgi:hypothetical protein
MAPGTEVDTCTRNKTKRRREKMRELPLAIVLILILVGLGLAGMSLTSAALGGKTVTATLGSSPPFLNSRIAGRQHSDVTKGACVITSASQIWRFGGNVISGGSQLVGGTWLLWISRLTAPPAPPSPSGRGMPSGQGVIRRCDEWGHGCRIWSSTFG